MTINITEPSPYPERISVGIDDDCTHAGAVAEPHEFWQFSNTDGIATLDEGYLQYIEVCERCKRWQDMDGCWNE